MAPSNDNVCYYGLHFGCLNATRGAECRECAERLTRAVQRILHPAREASDAHDAQHEDHSGGTANGHQEWRGEPLTGNPITNRSTL